MSPEDEKFLEALQVLDDASEAYHAHPSHASSCRTYEEHYGRRCPCEREGQAILRKKEEER